MDTGQGPRPSKEFIAPQRKRSSGRRRSELAFVRQKILFSDKGALDRCEGYHASRSLPEQRCQKVCLKPFIRLSKHRSRRLASLYSSSNQESGVRRLTRRSGINLLRMEDMTESYSAYWSALKPSQERRKQKGDGT